MMLVTSRHGGTTRSQSLSIYFICLSYVKLRYLITELNVNSAISSPDHHETLDVSKAEIELSLDAEQRMYTLRGYAYSGGGRRVTRCEVTLDDGYTWHLADM
jgi:nitrate reductase (NAD(P)H)